MSENLSSPLTLKQQIEQRMDELGIQPKRSLGQNFLINSHVVHKIIEIARQLQPAKIVEVGPGLGSLTTSLMELAREVSCELQLIEMDRKIAQYWRQKDLNVHEADALRFNWDELQLPEHTVLVSNLPYQISSRLVIERSAGPQAIDAMVLMFQKEVAERLAAKPKTAEYGFLTVVAQAFWSVSRVADVSPSDFYPAPKVDSRVLRFQRRQVDLDAGFVGFCKLAFTNRRKLFIKNFSDRKTSMAEIIESMGYTQKVRAEEMSVEDFQTIYKRYLV